MTSNAAEDDDTKFLLSFRSELKTMNSDQKIDFKMGMLQLEKKINMGNYPSSSRPPSQFYGDNTSSVSSADSIRNSRTPISQGLPLYYSVSSAPIQSTEDGEAAQLSILKSQNTQENNFSNYLKFK